MNCKKCGIEFDEKSGNGSFCSKSCHASYAAILGKLKNKIFNCTDCGIEIEVPYHQINKFPFRCKSCKKIYNKEVGLQTKFKKSIPGICENCGCEHSGTYGSGRFCSEKCSHSFCTKNEKKFTKKVYCTKCGKEVEVGKRTNPKKVVCEKCKELLKVCKVCGIEYITKNPESKYCSIKCSKTHYRDSEYKRKHSEGCKGHSGGYRENGGRSKFGYYKDIFCGSTYELAWVIWRLDHDLPVNRFKGYLEDKEIKLKYYPDFIEGNKIYEMKGYWTKKVDAKTDLAIRKGYEIDVLYKDDLKECFEWVYEKYKTKKLESLYDTKEK